MQTSLFAQQEEIPHIRELYSETQKSKNSYTRLSQDDDFNNSSEGGEITSYRDTKEVRLIEAIYYGHQGKVKCEYYFKNNEVYFVYIEEFRYNAPPMESSYEQKKTTKKESRYYFWNSKMIQWIEPNGEYVKSESTRFKEESEKISQWAIEILGIVN